MLLLQGIAAIADAGLRKKATDTPSEVSLHVMSYGSRGSPYGLSTGKFGSQSETSKFILLTFKLQELVSWITSFLSTIKSFVGK
jgi:hypothetical protein